MRRANCQILMCLMNDYWAGAAFGNKILDEKKVAELSSTIKDHAFNMLKVCEKQIDKSGWQQKKTKRRSQEVTCKDGEPAEKRGGTKLSASNSFLEKK